MNSSHGDIEGGRGGSNGTGKAASAYGLGARGSTEGPALTSLVKVVACITALGVCLLVLGGDLGFALFILSLCADGLVFARFLCDWLLAKDMGTIEMRAVSDPIREGSGAFLKVMYSAISQIAVIVMAVIFFSYQLRPDSMHGGINNLGSFTLGALGTLSFAIGAGCSAAAGYVSMWVAAQSNIRVASAARRSYMEALIICFRGGAFSAILVLALCVVGVTLLHTTLYLVFVTGQKGGIEGADVPLLCVGYGFGASFVALFMQLGGGIFTKAADVGSDMVGKIEAGIPEDDCRNPAVIADLVGDMVGDCVGSSADVFESVAAEIIGKFMARASA